MHERKDEKTQVKRSMTCDDEKMKMMSVVVKRKKHNDDERRRICLQRRRQRRVCTDAIADKGPKIFFFFAL